MLDPSRQRQPGRQSVRSENLNAYGRHPSTHRARPGGQLQIGQHHDHPAASL